MATWTITDTTATYVEGSGETQVVYATVKGLSNSLTAETVSAALEVSDNVITIHAAAVEGLSKSAKIQLTNGDDKNYTLAVGTDVNAEFNEWTFSKGTATYQTTKPIQFATSSTTEIKATTNKTSTVLTTISGLNKNLTDIDESVLSVDDTNKKITLTTAALGDTDIKLSNKKAKSYKLAVSGSYMTGEEDEPKIWIVNNTAAKFYDNADDFATAPGYLVGRAKIAYIEPELLKSAEPTITINGIKTGVVANGTGNIDGIRIDGTTVYVSMDLLNKKNITVSDGYKLAFEPTELSDSTNKLFTTDTGKISAEYSGSTLSIKQELKEGYTLAADGKAILYSEIASQECFLARI